MATSRQPRGCWTTLATAVLVLSYWLWRARGLSDAEAWARVDAEIQAALRPTQKEAE